MESSTRQHLVAACRRLMRPIARILIRGGVPFKDLVDLAKEAYVDVAGRDYGIRGRRTNTARVAILTGLSRKEVTRVRKQLAQETQHDEDGYANHASRVLAGWHQDADFVDSDGRPLPLLTDGGEPSLDELLRRYGGDMPAGALLTELKHVDAVRSDDRGRLVANKRYYMPAQLDPSAIERSGSVIEDLATTVNHNLYRDENVPSRFEGRATNLRVSRKAAEAFSRLVEEEGEKLLYAMDDWLTKHEVGEDEPDNAGIRLGVGVYLIEDKEHGTK